jgi:hypothetical protein
MSSLPAETVERQAPVTLTSTRSRAVDAIAEEMAGEILCDPDFDGRIKLPAD